MRTSIELVLRDAAGAARRFALHPGPEALLRVAREVRDPMRLALRMASADALGPPDTAEVFATLRIALETSGAGLSAEEADSLLFATGVAALWDPFAAYVGALVNGGLAPEADPPAAAAPPKKAAGVASAPKKQTARRRR